MRELLGRGIRDLLPGYFALVMATGIVSIACALLGLRGFAWPLLFINVAAYLTLWAMTIARLIYHPCRVLADLGDHVRGPGFFTVVAASCVLGNQIHLLTGQTLLAVGLWALGTCLWFVLMYSFFAAVTVRNPKPGIEAGLNGGWLLAVVATQAVSLLSAILAGDLPIRTEIVLFFALIMFLAGCMLYILIISLIFYRWTFFSLAPRALAPSYWINMGAVAITTRAGVTLALRADQWFFLRELAPFLKGFTLFFWATATWWIPLLVVLTAWRHLQMRYPLAYDAQYWGLVFPMGMYTVCTLQLSQIPGLGFVSSIAECFVYVAIVAWVTGATGLLRCLVREVRQVAPVKPSWRGESSLRASGAAGSEPESADRRMQ